MCQRQSSFGSDDAMAQVIPPCADTVCERVGNTFEIRAVLKPDRAICKEARIPDRPPPTTMACKVTVRTLIDQGPPQIMTRPQSRYTRINNAITACPSRRTPVAAAPTCKRVRYSVVTVHSPTQACAAIENNTRVLAICMHSEPMNAFHVR